MVYVAIMILPNSQILEVNGCVTPYEGWLIEQRGSRVEIKIDVDFGETLAIDLKIDDDDSKFWGGHIMKASRSRETLESWLKHHAIQDLTWHLQHSQR